LPTVSFRPSARGGTPVPLPRAAAPAEAPAGVAAPGEAERFRSAPRSGGPRPTPGTDAGKARAARFNSFRKAS
jgi:hypothetical protein